MEPSLSGYLSVFAVLFLASCRTTKPHYENQYRQHNNQPAAFYLTESRRPGRHTSTLATSYSAVINPPGPVEIKSEEITQIGKIINAELRARAKVQEDLANGTSTIDPYKPGSWKALTTNAPQPAKKTHHPHQMPLNSNRQAMAPYASNMHSPPSSGNDWYLRAGNLDQPTTSAGKGEFYL